MNMTKANSRRLRFKGRFVKSKTTKKNRIEKQENMEGAGCVGLEESNLQVWQGEPVYSESEVSVQRIDDNFSDYLTVMLGECE